MASAADNEVLRGFMQTWTIVGIYGTWIRSLLNGTLASIFHAMHVSGVLPGTDTTLSTTLTGIYWPFDYLLDILILFFCNAVDGSYPPTSVFGLWFAGQHTAVITILYLDCYRSGPNFSWRTRFACTLVPPTTLCPFGSSPGDNGSRRRSTVETDMICVVLEVSATLWLLLFQLTSIAVTGPLYFLISRGGVDLVRSQAKPSLRLIQTLPVSIVAGYLGILVLMALPGEGARAVVSSHVHQVLIALWNMFPLIVGTCQMVLERLVPSRDADRHPGGGSGGGRDDDERQAAIEASRPAYSLALFVTVASHFGVVVLTASAWLFPQLFSPDGIAGLQAGKVWRLPLSHATVDSLGPGILQFMQWDSLVGFTALLVQVTVESRARAHTKGWRAWSVVIVQVVAAAAALGPGSAALLVRWADDEEALTKGKTE